jgi:hypothetical protein
LDPLKTFRRKVLAERGEADASSLILEIVVGLLKQTGEYAERKRVSKVA